jgi:5-methylcytosine-specific restriction enzyme A
MISRKRFIQAQGATCKNWTWSWSFVNHRKKIIIFGAWDIHTTASMSLIFSKNWAISGKGRKLPAFDESREHIRLIEEEGYRLQTFPMKYSGVYKDEHGVGPAKIAGFTPRLETKYLKRISENWYASDGKDSVQIAEEVDKTELLIEGASKTISVNVYERNATAKTKCLAHHGYKCVVCSFDFEIFYGSIGQNYIHVHHIVPLSEVNGEYALDPIKDLVPICPNCHAMIHRTRPILTVEQLKDHLESVRKSLRI